MAFEVKRKLAETALVIAKEQVTIPSIFLLLLRCFINILDE
jgi:hypothetical protein